MKESFRQCNAWLHTWTGLVAGWLLFFVFVTGTASYFQHEITLWMQPERAVSIGQPVVDTAGAVSRAFDRLQQVAPDAASWRVSLPHASLAPRGWQDFAIRWEELPAPGHEWGLGGTERLDPATGATLPPIPPPRATAGGFGLYRMHYVLHYIPVMWGIWIVGVATMLMLLAILTGVITHKKIFTDFFTFRPGKGQRSWLDAHNAISVMALPFFLMITYSGLLFFMFTYMPAGRDLLYGASQKGHVAYEEELTGEAEHKHTAIGRPQAPLAPMIAAAEAQFGRGKLASVQVEGHEGEPAAVTLSAANGGSLDFWNPSSLRFDARSGKALPPEPVHGSTGMHAQGIMFNLHEGLFAGIWGRWLYFISGLLGCAMIATGMVLWTVKRRKHHLINAREEGEHAGVRLVETINVAVIAGLPLAVSAYFWANRLLPLDLAERASWELHTLFVVWLGTLFYAMARPLRRAWIELLCADAVAFALVPVLNAITTDVHLGHTLVGGDWVRAGFDLTMLALGGSFAVAAVKVRRRLMPPAPVQSGTSWEAV